jgi:lysophospholipase L1-like esterase
LIFQRTIYRENRNFNNGSNDFESSRIALADSLMKIACKKYKDVYYIHPSATAKDHETTQDGIHPSDQGYQLWAESIEKPVMKILRKYGIK